MTPEEQAELDINVAADLNNGPTYIAAVQGDKQCEQRSGWYGVVAVVAAAVFICWLILRLG